MVSAVERALKLLKEENQTSSELLAELKSSLKQLRAVDHDDQEVQHLAYAVQHMLCFL